MYNKFLQHMTHVFWKEEGTALFRTVVVVRGRRCHFCTDLILEYCCCILKYNTECCPAISMLPHYYRYWCVGIGLYHFKQKSCTSFLFVLCRQNSTSFLYSCSGVGSSIVTYWKKKQYHYYTTLYYFYYMIILCTAAVFVLHTLLYIWFMIITSVVHLLKCE